MSFMVERAIGSTAASGAAISSWYLLRYLLLLLHGLLFLRFLELSPLGDFESLYSFDEEVAGAREASLSSLACLSVRRGCFCLDFGIGASTVVCSCDEVRKWGPSKFYGGGFSEHLNFKIDIFLYFW